MHLHYLIISVEDNPADLIPEDVQLLVELFNLLHLLLLLLNTVELVFDRIYLLRV